MFSHERGHRSLQGKRAGVSAAQVEEYIDCHINTETHKITPSLSDITDDSDADLVWPNNHLAWSGWVNLDEDYETEN